LQNLNNLLKLLLDEDIEFLIVGGFAAVVHGSNHVTRDLDITMMMSEGNIEKLRSVLKEHSPIHRMNREAKLSFLEHPKKLSGINNLYLETDLGVLDVVSLDPELGDFGELYERAERVDLFGKECRVLSLDDLIKVKSRLGRTKDKIVLEELLEIKRSKES
jgi:predicted nucleotidyltransferase